MKENNNNEVLIVGLPNSGKSTLVNVLTSKKVSIIGSTLTLQETRYQPLLKLIINELLFQIYQDI